MPVQYHHCLQPFLADFLRQPFGLTNSQTRKIGFYRNLISQVIFALFTPQKWSKMPEKSIFYTKMSLTVTLKCSYANSIAVVGFFCGATFHITAFPENQRLRENSVILFRLTKVKKSNVNKSSFYLVKVSKIRAKLEFTKKMYSRNFVKCLQMSPRVSRSMSTQLTQTSFENGVKKVTMTAAKTRNSLSLEMLKILENHIVSDAQDPELRCIVLSGQGPAFSAGHNLKEMTYKEGKEYHEEIFKKCNDLMRSIVTCPVPVIAQVDGVAAAAGCQLVAMCDIAVATAKSSFLVPGSSVGLFCSTPGVPLARAVPRKISSYMLLTGKPIKADEALQAGLISRMVLNPEELEQEVQAICQAIIDKPRGVIALGKKFYYQQLEMGLTQALDQGGQVMVDNLQLQDAQEGIAAFVEKRRPQWCHTDQPFQKS